MLLSRYDVFLVLLLFFVTFLLTSYSQSLFKDIVYRRHAEHQLVDDVDDVRGIAHRRLEHQFFRNDNKVSVLDLLRTFPGEGPDGRAVRLHYVGTFGVGRG